MADDAMIRRENLTRLGKTPGELVNILGRTYSYWRDLMTNPNKSFGEKAARRIEDGWPLPRGWLDRVHDADASVPPPGSNLGIALDHEPSYPSVTLPPITPWEVVVSVEKLPVIPSDLMVEVADNALAPRQISKGQHIWFKAASSAEPGNVVLIEVGGRRFIRRYAEDEKGVIAQALDDAFPSFRDFKVVAVMHMRPGSSI